MKIANCKAQNGKSSKLKGNKGRKGREREGNDTVRYKAQGARFKEQGIRKQEIGKRIKDFFELRVLGCTLKD
jgi:hypothetical protein